MNTDFFDNKSCLAYTFAVCQQFEQFYKDANLADQNLAEAKSEQINVDDKSLQLTYKLTDLLDISTFRVKSKDRNTLKLSGKMKRQSCSINGLQFTPDHSWSQEITLPNWIDRNRLTATVCTDTRTLSISH